MAVDFVIDGGIDKRLLTDFNTACDRFKSELGNTHLQAVRRGVIYLVQSLRARTIKAKKYAPSTDIVKSPEHPKWITPKGGGKPLRRWRVKRHGGSRTKYYYYTGETRAQVRKEHAQYSRFGLAKKSWGWFMQSLFKRNAPADNNPKAVVDSRMVEGHLHEFVTGNNPRIDVLIVNKLNYIRSALPSTALDDSIKAATARINAAIDSGLLKAKRNIE